MTYNRVETPVLIAICSTIVGPLFVSFGGTDSITCTFAQAASVINEKDAAPDELLRWQFRVGQVFHIEERVTENFLHPKGRKHRNTKEYEYTWTVRDVNEKGFAEIAVNFTRVKWQLEVPRKLEFDSLEDNPTSKPTESPELRNLAFSARSLTNAELVCMVGPRGKIALLKGGESVFGPMQFTPGDWPALPEKRVSLNDNWRVPVGFATERIAIGGTANYRIEDIATIESRRLVWIKGKVKTTSIKNDPALGAGTKIRPTTFSALFDNSAGRFDESQLETSVRAEVSPNRFADAETVGSRRIIKVEKDREQALQNGRYLVTFKQGKPTFVYIAGVIQVIPESEMEVGQILEVDFFHDWKDINNDQISFFDELIGVNNRFDVNEKVNINFTIIGLASDNLRFEILDATGTKMADQSVGIRGPAAYAVRNIGGLRAGMYFFTFYLNDEYLMRVPIQVVGAGQTPTTTSD